MLPEPLKVPRESCFPILRDIVLSGKIKFDPERNNFPITLHDPCNVTRLMGIIKPQRDIVHKLCPQFREGLSCTLIFSVASHSTPLVNPKPPAWLQKAARAVRIRAQAGDVAAGHHHRDQVSSVLVAHLRRS